MAGIRPQWHSYSLFHAGRTVRLVVTRMLKGEAPKVLELVIAHCQGANMAELGSEVTAYRIGEHWRLDEPPGDHAESMPDMQQPL